MDWDSCDKENIARKVGRVGMCKNMVMNAGAISKVSSSIIFSFFFCCGMWWH